MRQRIKSMEVNGSIKPVFNVVVDGQLFRSRHSCVRIGTSGTPHQVERSLVRKLNIARHNIAVSRAAAAI